MKARIKCLPPVWSGPQGSIVSNDHGSVKLNNTETLILFALMGHRVLHRNDLVDILWPEIDDEPEWQFTSIRVRIHNMRRKLAPVGVYIRNSYSFGWSLTLANEDLGNCPQYRVAA